MKTILFLLSAIVANAEIIKMDDGTCYERKGKMNYIVPCPSKKPAKSDTAETAQAPDGECVFRVGEYEMRYIEPRPEEGEGVSCIDAQHYIDRVNLGYDKSLKINKKKIGRLIARRALSKCNVELYYGDFLTVGIMSGDRLMCDDLMAYFSVIGRSR